MRRTNVDEAFNGADANQRRSRRASAREPLRLEGLVVQKRMANVERTRYLVIDFKAGSISLYKRPPPKSEFSARSSLTKQSGAVGSAVKLAAKKKSFLGKNSSEKNDSLKSEVAFENLAHISRKNNYFGGGTWDPKWTIPSSVDWKFRDVENDETLFYLVLPADYSTHDSDAEVVSLYKVGKSVSYRSLNDLDKDKRTNSKMGSLGSVTEEKMSVFDFGVDDEDDEDGSDVTGSKSGMKSRFLSKAFKSVSSDKSKKEIIYQFRVLLDGNEKFIWLQAASEMNRLASENATSIVNTVNVTRGLFSLPTQRGKASLTALRYAEWARLVDQNKSVSNTQFNVRDLRKARNAHGDDQYDSTHLVKILPTYAYRNRRMTERDLYYEMLQPSEKWEDFRGMKVKDRDEPAIGSLHCEVLACHGLPKLDRFSSTDGCCYFVCGPFAFASDVIDGHLSPVWPSKSRRACIFPIFHAYMKLYVAVFDDDGAAAHDDFAGRVVIDIAKLRPGSAYDVYFPLRMYQNAYINHPRGVIHLRLRLDWYNERKVLLSYLKLPKKNEKLGNTVTLNCADLKSFRNAVFTVQGKDVPGKFKQNVMKSLQREMKLYKIVMKTTMQEQMKDIVFWVHPLTSFCIFVAWMHCVYSNSMAFVPVYIVAGVISLLLSNYEHFGKDEDFNGGFTPITISELFLSLVFGRDNTRYIKPIHVERKGNQAQSSRGEEQECLMQQSVQVLSGGGVRMDGDHLEFPFSEKGRYPKKTLSEACVDANSMFLEEDDDQDTQATGRFGSLRRRNKKKMIRFARNTDDDDYDDDEDEDEFDLSSNNDRVLSHIPRGEEIAEKIHEFEQGVGIMGPSSPSKSAPNISAADVTVAPSNQDRVWKRTKEPLPEQDASVAVKQKKTLKEEILHNKNLMHKMSMRMFDDRMFVIDENDPSSVGEELALDNAMGTHKHNNPMVAKMAEYMGPMMEMLKVGLSVWRAIFNLFTWRDPFLSFWFLLGAVCLLFVLIIFPWRLFFFAMGFGIVGPQNWIIRIKREMYPTKAKPPAEQDLTPKLQVRKTKIGRRSSFDEAGMLAKMSVITSAGQASKNAESSDEFRFHNHLLTMGGNDLREEKSIKSSGTVHRAVVPNSPLISRRFYDWPPNPSLSKVDIHSEQVDALG